MDMSRGLGGVHTVTWFDTGVGLREMLMRSESDAAQVKATLHGRGYELTVIGNLLPSEVAQVLVLPLFRPRQWVPLEQEEGEEGEMVAMVQLVRPFGSPPNPNPNSNPNPNPNPDPDPSPNPDPDPNPNPDPKQVSREKKQRRKQQKEKGATGGEVLSMIASPWGWG